MENPSTEQTVTCRARFCENGGKVREMVRASKVRASDKRGYYCPDCASNGGRRLTYSQLKAKMLAEIAHSETA